MTIPTIEYRGFVLRAYSQKLFPTHHDPCAAGPKKYSSVVLIDTVPSSGSMARRYATTFPDGHSNSSNDAIDMAMRYGKSIIDGRIHPTQL